MARETRMLDRMIAGFGQAVDDIRAKLIDEAWFGRRAASPRQFEPQDLGWDGPDTRRSGQEPSFMPRPSFEDMWATREREPAGLEPDRDQDPELER